MFSLGYIDRNSPFHPLRALLGIRSNLPQLFAQQTHLLDCSPGILRQRAGNLLPDYICQFRPVTIRTNHNLQRTIAMHATKVKVAFRRHIGYVCGYTALFAKFPNLSRGFGVVDCAEDHVGIVEIVGLEVAVDMGDLVLGDAIGDFLIETGLRTDDGHFGIGIEDIENTTRCYLSLYLICQPLHLG